MSEKPKSYTSRNTKRSWSSANYRYYVGQRVLWPEGSRGGIPFGVCGTVVDIPREGQRSLLVKLDDREETVPFRGGSNLVPIRIVFENNAKLRAQQAKAYRQALGALDYLGRPVMD